MDNDTDEEYFVAVKLNHNENHKINSVKAILRLFREEEFDELKTGD